jgi:hypothetical protein
MKQIATELATTASPQRLWDVLTEFNRYSEWSPLFAGLDGEPRVGEKIVLTLRPGSTGKTRSAAATISAVIPQEYLEWRGSLLLPALYRGVHRFRITPTFPGSLLNNSEDISGLLAALMMNENRLEQGRHLFRAHNEALIARAESSAR